MEGSLCNPEVTIGDRAEWFCQGAALVVVVAIQGIVGLWIMSLGIVTFVGNEWANHLSFVRKGRCAENRKHAKSAQCPKEQPNNYSTVLFLYGDVCNCPSRHTVGQKEEERLRSSAWIIQDAFTRTIGQPTGLMLLPSDVRRISLECKLNSMKAAETLAGRRGRLVKVVTLFILIMTHRARARLPLR